jgi:hypothetical protein
MVYPKPDEVLRKHGKTHVDVYYFQLALLNVFMPKFRMVCEIRGVIMGPGRRYANWSHMAAYNELVSLLVDSESDDQWMPVVSSAKLPMLNRMRYNIYCSFLLTSFVHAPPIKDVDDIDDFEIKNGKELLKSALVVDTSGQVLLEHEKTWLHEWLMATEVAAVPGLADASQPQHTWQCLLRTDHP